MSRLNKPVTVAVLDTGVYTNHPDLMGVVTGSWNCVSDRPGGEFQF